MTAILVLMALVGQAPNFFGLGDQPLPSPIPSKAIEVIGIAGHYSKAWRMSDEDILALARADALVEMATRYQHDTELQILKKFGDTDATAVVTDTEQFSYDCGKPKTACKIISDYVVCVTEKATCPKSDDSQ